MSAHLDAECHCEECNDEAIQLKSYWIAAVGFTSLAMTNGRA
jgi:hypothetical protein